MDSELDTLVRLRLLARNSRLVDARKEKGWTQPELAQLMGCSNWHISHVETLKVIPDPEEQDFFAKFLEKPPDYLFPESLLKAIRAGVFTRRYAELREPQVVTLTEVRPLLLSYDPTDMIEEEVDRKMLRENIDKVMDTLTPGEKKVLELRFSLDGGEPKSLEEIAEYSRRGDIPGHRCGTREAIRRIEHNALQKMRHPSRSRKLKSYLD